MDATGGDLRVLVAGDINGAPSWSPDGRRIAFERAAYGFGSEIWIVRADGSGLRQLTRRRPNGPRCEVDRWPDWAPDGSTIVFGRNVGNACEQTQLYTIKPDGSRLTRLGPRKLVTDVPGVVPPSDARYSPVGTTIVSNDVIRRGSAIYDRIRSAAWARRRYGSASTLRPVRRALRDRLHGDAVLAGRRLREGRRRAALTERAAGAGRLLHVSRARAAGAARRRGGDEVRARVGDRALRSRHQHRTQQGRPRAARRPGGSPRAGARGDPGARHQRARLAHRHQRSEGRARRESERRPHLVVARRRRSRRDGGSGAHRGARRLGDPGAGRVLPAEGGAGGDRITVTSRSGAGSGSPPPGERTVSSPCGRCRRRSYRRTSTRREVDTASRSSRAAGRSSRRRATTATTSS